MMYVLVRFFLWVASKFVYRVRVTGRENIPKNGAFILCSNHIHSYDPAMLAINIKRKLRFMAKKELFQPKLKGIFFRSLGAFPVNRGEADITSYRIAMKALSAEMGLVVFSQGTRLQELDVKGAKGGVALFAIKSKSPILPVGISGNYKLFGTININFGKIITVETETTRVKTEQIEQIMEQVMLEVQKLI
ncbi:MAG: 1-acyl-sn-glycerol-3-phosphate acyltransferase [Turicibacter sp.]|nr:1-acyl-sn-glycerol-3-phosphate acyltransferase [Turicibacter sp.]